MNWSTRILLTVCLLLATACHKQGELDGACNPDGTCSYPGLTCVEPAMGWAECRKSVNPAAALMQVLLIKVLSK